MIYDFWLSISFAFIIVIGWLMLLAQYKVRENRIQNLAWRVNSMLRRQGIYL